MIEAVAVFVAAAAAYLTWRGLVVMSATMQIAARSREEEAMRWTSAALARLGMTIQTLGGIYQGVQGNQELVGDPVNKQHWLAARMSAVEKLNASELEARVARVRCTDLIVKEAAGEAIDKAESVTDRLEKHQPLDSDDDAAEKLFKETREAGLTLIAVGEKAAQIASRVGTEIARQERRGRSLWRR